MATFVLIHGSMHGDWCWRDLTPRLEERGHVVIVPDLPCDDVEAGLTDYASVVERALPNGTPAEELHFVGHSLGSRTLPLVAFDRPRSNMIFLCSAPTPPGPIDPASFSEMVTAEYREARFDERPDGARRIDEGTSRRLFFHDCEDETAIWAAGQLRFQGPKPLSEASPLDQWPSASMHMIIARGDRVAHPQWLIAEAEKWPGMPRPIFIEGGHSPMLSRPSDLRDLLVELAGD